MPGKQAVDLSYAIGLPPEKAIEYFSSKGYKTTYDWQSLWQDSQTKAFTVAGVARMDILQDIKGMIDKAMAEGMPLQEFKDSLIPRLQAKGWLSNSPEKMPYRLENMYRTNIQTAFMAGRYREMMENVKDRPYWQYVAVMDSRTRPAHSALNGKVFRYDDPFWKVHYPPNGFQCRCRVRSLSEQDVEARKLTVESGKDNMVWEERLTVGGYTKPTAAYVDPVTGKKLFTDPGWSYNPGEKFWKPYLRKYNKDIRAAFEKEMAEFKAGVTNPFADLKPIQGTQKGSNPGGIYENVEGEKFYVKFYADANQARTEYAANKIYKSLGVEVPESYLAELQTFSGNKKLAFITKWHPDLKRITAQEMTQHPEDLAKIFHSSVLVKNWDVVGMEYDNLLLNSKGKLTLIDAGGSFKFRAKGLPKSYGTDIDEVSTFLSPSKNPQSAKVFGEIDKNNALFGKKYTTWLKKLNSSGVMDIMKSAGFSEIESKELTDALIARRNSLVKYMKSLEGAGADKLNIKRYMGSGYDYYKRQYVQAREEIRSMLSELEYVITKGYTGNSYYHDINGTLVKKAGEVYNSHFRELDDRTINSIKRQMDNALDKLPKTNNSVVYRGTKLTNEVIESKFIEGRNVILPGYQSSSETSPFTSGKNVIYKINLTKKEGGLVKLISDFSSENEFILKSGKQYKVLKKEMINNKWHIELEEL